MKLYKKKIQNKDISIKSSMFIIKKKNLKLFCHNKKFILEKLVFHLMWTIKLNIVIKIEYAIRIMEIIECLHQVEILK